MGTALSITVGLVALVSAITTLPPLLVQWERSRTPEVLFHVDTPEQVVALTIDDGPSSSTSEILEVLSANDAKATFFVIGSNVRADPDLTRRIREEGHELGHHMMFDERSIDLSPDTFRQRFVEMDAILADFGASKVFRPASGWYDARMIAEAGRLGYRTVLGSAYAFDAQLPSRKLSTWYMRRLVRPGSVLILHDGARRGARTADVLRVLLPHLRARGFRVVPVTELMALERPSREAVDVLQAVPAARPGDRDSRVSGPARPNQDDVTVRPGYGPAKDA